MRRVVIAFAGLALAGCATSSRAPEAKTAADRRSSAREPRCTTATSLLAAAAHKPAGGMLALGSDGYAIVWAEQAQRSTLRFELVDRNGQPRGPSVEVVDSAQPIAPLEVHLDGQGGYVVAWREGNEARSRALDPRGRPRGDVASLATAPAASPAPAGAPVISTDAEGLKLAAQVCEKE